MPDNQKKIADKSAISKDHLTELILATVQKDNHHPGREGNRKTNAYRTPHEYTLRELLVVRDVIATRKKFTENNNCDNCHQSITIIKIHTSQVIAHNHIEMDYGCCILKTQHTTGVQSKSPCISQKATIVATDIK